MTAGHGSKRPSREHAALAALLTEPTIAGAAKQVGISESTLLRWLADPPFKARFRDARRQVVEHSVSRLQQASSEAVDALRRNLTCGIPAVEVGAARTVLSESIKAIELVDLAERVEQLEEAAERAAQLQEAAERAAQLQEAASLRAATGDHGPDEPDQPDGDDAGATDDENVGLTVSGLPT